MRPRRASLAGLTHGCTSPFPPLRDWLQRLPTHLGAGPIALDTPLIESGLLDLIGLLELVSFLEERFSVALPLDEFVPENFRTPTTVLAMVDRARAFAAAA